MLGTTPAGRVQRSGGLTASSLKMESRFSTHYRLSSQGHPDMLAPPQTMCINNSLPYTSAFGLSSKVSCRRQMQHPDTPISALSKRCLAPRPFHSWKINLLSCQAKSGLYTKGGRTCTFLCPRLIRARRNLVLNNRMANADTLKGAGIKSTRRRGTRKCQWRHVLNRTQFPRRWGTATLMDRSKSSIRPVPAMPKASHTVVPGEIGNRPSALKGT